MMPLWQGFDQLSLAVGFLAGWSLSGAVFVWLMSRTR